MKLLPTLLIFLMIFASEAQTRLSLPPLGKPPQIDGRISQEEWSGASMQLGGISRETGLLSKRKVIFYIGYDDRNFYFAQQSELPPKQMKIKDNGIAAISLTPPGGKTMTFSFKQNGNSQLPSGSILKQSENNDFWYSELSIPITALGVDVLSFGQDWGLQMSRTWSNPAETSFWHLPTAEQQSGVLRLEKNIPRISFSNFQDKTTSYSIRYSVFNVSSNPVELSLNANISSLEAPVNMHRLFKLPPGKEENPIFHNILATGVYRTFSAKITNNIDKSVYYERSFSWDSGKNLDWVDPDPPYVFRISVYPSHKTIRNRLICSSTRKLRAVSEVKVKVRNKDGKVMSERSLERRSNNDFYLQWEEPAMDSWAEGEYFIDAIFKDDKGKDQKITRNFGIYKFAWEKNKSGKSKIIVPPFKPLKVNDNEVHALQTGYRRAGVFWDAVYAQGENILAAPIDLMINGEKLKPVATRKIIADDDRVLFETDLRYRNLLLTAVHDYDYDGMCKVTLKFTPDGQVKIDRMYFDIRMKKEYARLYHATGARLRSNFHGFINQSDGIAWDSLRGRCLNPLLKGFRPYIWFGEIYKGFCWFAETPLNWSINPEKPAQTLTVENDAVCLRINLVNRPVIRNKSFEIVMGFQPTPVKPQPGIKALAGSNYTYTPQAARNKYWRAAYSYMAMRYDEGLLENPPNGDWSFIEYMARADWKDKSEAQEFAREYIKRNNIDNNNLSQYTYSRVTNVDRQMRVGCEMYKSSDYRIQYQNPRSVSPTREFDMYVDEWNLWDCRPAKSMDHFNYDPDDKYADWLLYSIRKFFQYGFGGIYYDNIFDTLCYNSFKGPAVEIQPGKIMPYYPFFAMRSLLKRSAVMLTEEGKLFDGYPMLESHITDTTMVPLCSFNSSILDWEMQFGSKPYPERFPQEYILTNTIGTQTGNLGRVLLQSSSDDESVLRSLLSVIFANSLMSFEALARFPAKPFFRHAVDIVFEFGFDLKDTVVYPGWSPDNPVKVQPESVMATAVKRKDGEVLLMIGNLKDTCSASFELGNFASGKIVNAETGELLGSGNKFTVKIPKHDYLLIRVGRTVPSLAGWKSAVRAKLAHHEDKLVLSDIGLDSQIINHHLNLDPEKVKSITIEYRAEGIEAKTTGQLFFATSDNPKFSSPRIFRLPSLKNDGQWHSIQIDTTRLKEWKQAGNVTSIRLDMMDQAGGKIEIRKIQFNY